LTEDRQKIGKNLYSPYHRIGILKNERFKKEGKGKMDIKQELQENKIIAIVMPNKLYMQESSKLIDGIISCCNKICYITLTKPYSLLAQKYKDHVKNFFFVDAVTKTVISKPKKADNVAYVKSQTAFKGLKETIDKSVSRQKSEVALFDNLSNLFVFQKSIEAINFAHLIAASLSIMKCKTIFICIKGDMDERSLGALSMFVDKTIYLE